MGINKNWTPEEFDYLESNWGMVSIPGIAKHLGRSIEAVKIKAQRLGLGRHIHCSEDITVNQLAQACGRSYNVMKSVWIPKGLPYKYRKSVKKKFKVISIPDFWKWAEQHRTLINFAKVEVNILGEEPDWVAEQRASDIAAMKFKRIPWSHKEDEKLKHLLKLYKYGYHELSQMLNRTAGAIQKRIVDLKLKERPLKADNNNKWALEEENKLIQMVRQGYARDVIAEYLPGRSAKAIQGKIERMSKQL